MSISKNDSDVKSNVTELAVFIAHELEIDNSQVWFLRFSSVKVTNLMTDSIKIIQSRLPIDCDQVRLLNFTSEGNEYLIKLGIFPGQSANYISNTTALVMLLLRHQSMLVLLNPFPIDWQYIQSKLFLHPCMQNIILRLKEHRLHLPERFGSYQLVEWNAEPEMNLYVPCTCYFQLKQLLPYVILR